MIYYSTVFVFRFSLAIIKTLFLDPPTSTTKSQLKDALQDVLENPEKWLRRAEKFLDFHVAFKDGNSAKIFAKELIEIAKKKTTFDSYYPIRSHVKYIIELITRKFK